MNRHLFAVLAIVALAACASAQEPVPLPPPKMYGGMPLMEALKARSSSREFSDKPVGSQVVSDLLWAGYGINRPDSGKRTAPSAMNKQEIDVYVLTPDGAFLYDAKAHALKLVAAGDLRALAGSQPFVKDAPLNLVYVADYARMEGDDDTRKAVWSAADSGFISQNVYLFCASEGLATVVRAWFDAKALAEGLKLSPTQHPVLAQTVGYPKE